MNRGRVLWGGAVLCLAAGVASASTVIGLTIEDQARLSRLVVVGTVVSQAGVEHPANGLETEVGLLVTDVFKGNVAPGQTVVFHTRGGELDGVISEAVGEATFSTGQRTLVFVEEVNGRLYLLGLSMGAWDVREEAGRVSFTRALRDGLQVVGDARIETGPVDYGTMAARIQWSQRRPSFDSDLLRQVFGQGR